MRSLVVLTGLLLTVVYSDTQAQGCCTGGVPLAGTYAISNLTESQWTIAVTYDNHWMKALMAGREVFSNPTVQRNSQSIIAQLGYGINDRWSLSLLLSHIWQIEETINTSSYTKFSSSGLGDAQVNAQYMLLNKTSVQWVAGAGVLIPFADTRQSQDDFVLPPSLQPGTGAFGGMIFTNLAYSPAFRPQLVISNALFYRFNGESDRFANVESYQFGGIFQWFLTASDQFVTGTLIHYPGLSLQAKYQQFDKINEQKNDNTGGTWWFLMPSYKIAWSPAFSNFLQAELPIYRNVNGFQITSSYRITIGVNLIL